MSFILIILKYVFYIQVELYKFLILIDETFFIKVTEYNNFIVFSVGVTTVLHAEKELANFVCFKSAHHPFIKGLNVPFKHYSVSDFIIVSDDLVLYCYICNCEPELSLIVQVYYNYFYKSVFNVFLICSVFSI